MKKGIDVSYANGYIDWSNVKSEIDFAIIRSSFGSDLPSQTDSFFFQNASGCVKNGIPFGIYHFAYFINEQTARDEADFAIKKANEFKEYVRFIALDVEEDSQRYAKDVGANPDWTACAVAFLERVRAAGFVPVIYTNQAWMTQLFDWSKLVKYKLWYAAPGASSPKYSCAIWQYSWEGKHKGMTGNVDLDILYDDSLLTAAYENTAQTVRTDKNESDREKILAKATDYMGFTGQDICIRILKLGFIVDWCAYAVCAIMYECHFVGKYIKAIEGGAGTIPRYSDGKYGEWFKKGTKTPQPCDLFFLRYNDYPGQDKYFCDHVGIVESVNGNIITTLEGNVDGISGNWAATSTFKRKTRYLSDSTMYAFYRPYWKESESDTKPEKTTSQNVVYQVESAEDVNILVQVEARDGLNLRSGASTSYSKLGAIPCGEKLLITKKTSGGGYAWGLTTYSGMIGWVALDYTKAYNPEIKKGSRVKVKQGATVYGTNNKLSDFVYKTILDVIEVSDSNRVVIGFGNNVTAAVHRLDLIVVS